MTPGHSLLLLAAGTAAGIVGSAGGTASLISYPALLAAGLTPLAANVANAVAFVAAWPGSALGSRAELRGEGSWLRRQAPLVVAGSAAGAALLLVTPAAAFARVVPYLLALAALALLLQPKATKWLASRPAGQPGLLLPVGLIAVSVYDGYWGAGAGIMTLTVLMIATVHPLVQANALKNMLLGIADVACCVVFVLCWPVDWQAVIPMAVGCLIGGAIGPSVTRHLPGRALRILAALAGLALAVRLWIAA
ncbi:MAG: TSUP family transporter [Streptosporangiaceae bacterium]